jgi:hypothetical protein
MGGDAQLDKVTKTINVSGPDKTAIVNRPQILARPLNHQLCCEFERLR